jgi:hypothetical protein
MDQQTDDCAQGYYWTLPLSGWGGSKLPAAYQSPTALRHRRARSHYACTQSHTQSTLFATIKQPPRSLALSPPQQQRACETRGLQLLMRCCGRLGDCAALLDEQGNTSGVVRVLQVQIDPTASLALPFSPSVQYYMGRLSRSRPLSTSQHNRVYVAVCCTLVLLPPIARVSAHVIF